MSFSRWQQDSVSHCMPLCIDDINSSLFLCFIVFGVFLRTRAGYSKPVSSTKKFKSIFPAGSSLAWKYFPQTCHDE
jgi:hypothetical protein